MRVRFKKRLFGIIPRSFSGLGEVVGYHGKRYMVVRCDHTGRFIRLDYEKDFVQDTAFRNKKKRR